MRSSADTRSDIVNAIIDSGIVERCVKYQARGGTDYWREELMQEIWLWLLTYDEERLRNAWLGNHINALVSAFIRNQYHSSTSNFYRTYKRPDMLSDEITERERQIPDEKTTSN